jgi:creatine kinase
MESKQMQAASGYHQFWPWGRGIFVNSTKTFLVWVNEGDHIRIISMQEGGDVSEVFTRLGRAIKAMEEGIRKATGQSDKVFMEDEKLGTISCCPSNLGGGLRASVHIRVPKLIEKWGFDKIDEVARERFCQARGSTGEHSEVVDRIDVSNWRRLGFSEAELVTDMINCVNYLAEEEAKLEAES